MNVTRNLLIGVIVAALVTALLIVVFVGENARMDKETLAQKGESISRGSMLYDSYCAGCHGDRGQGIPGVYPPLNVEDLWSGREEIAFYGTLEDYVALNISAGHPNQRMPSWSQEFGGPLRDDQIVDLTSFVLNWQGPQPPSVRQPGVEAPRPTEPPRRQRQRVRQSRQAKGMRPMVRRSLLRPALPATALTQPEAPWARRSSAPIWPPRIPISSGRPSTRVGPVQPCLPGRAC